MPRTKHLPNAPGLRQLLPLPYGLLARTRRDPLGFLTDSARQFGDVFRYQIGPFRFHLVSHPDHVKHVLADNYANYPRSFLYRMTKLVIGDGLVSVEGDVWRRQRRMVQPAFSPHRLAPLAQMMTDATSAMLDRWDARFADTGKPFDVADEMIRLTLRIVGKTLLGVELGGDTDTIGPAVTESLSYLDHRITNLVTLPLIVPTPRNLRFRAAMRTLDKLVYGIIAQRRAGHIDAPDLLGRLLAARDEETGAAMTDRELRNQIMTFIGAGHETTAVALTWTLALLAEHPDVEARVRAEIAEALAGRTPTVQDLPRLPFLRRVIEESLRLYPPVFGVVRDVLKDDQIAGYHIPAGSSVILSQYVTHRRPDVWENPEAFDPDRFLPDRAAGRPRFAWFPFLGGPHQCVGENFAMMEAALILTMIHRRHRLTLVPGTQIEPKPMLSLRPKNGLPMTARRVTSTEFSQPSHHGR